MCEMFKRVTDVPVVYCDQIPPLAGELDEA